MGDPEGEPDEAPSEVEVAPFRMTVRSLLSPPFQAAPRWGTMPSIEAALWPLSTARKWTVSPGATARNAGRTP
jgi:hypothetical protein